MVPDRPLRRPAPPRPRHHALPARLAGLRLTALPMSSLMSVVRTSHGGGRDKAGSKHGGGEQDDRLMGMQRALEDIASTDPDASDLARSAFRWLPRPRSWSKGTAALVVHHGVRDVTRLFRCRTCTSRIGRPGRPFAQRFGRGAVGEECRQPLQPFRPIRHGPFSGSGEEPAVTVF